MKRPPKTEKAPGLATRRSLSGISSNDTRILLLNSLKINRPVRDFIAKWWEPLYGAIHITERHLLRGLRKFVAKPARRVVPSHIPDCIIAAALENLERRGLIMPCGFLPHGDSSRVASQLWVIRSGGDR